jgi:hypothetical protein
VFERQEPEAQRAPEETIISMTTRDQLKGWLCASSLFGALAFTHVAQAAHPARVDSAPPPSTPRTAPPSVKLPPRIIPQLVMTPRLSLPPPRLELKQPGPLPPSRGFRHEILWLGMRIPTLIAFGLSSVSAGGAVVTGYAATHGNDPSTCDTGCTEHGVRRRALLLTTGVLTGMAVAGVGIGITFMVKEPADQKAKAVRPRVDLRVSGQNAVAKIGWVFSSF